MLTIIIFKWVFIFSTIGLGVYHYKLELRKLNKISKQINNPKLISELKATARMRMIHFFLLFAAFIIWIMSYDIEIQNVNKEKTQLAGELEKASQKYANYSYNQNRLIKPKLSDQNLADDIKSYYTDIFVNYYVMRKCNLAGSDDAFIINSALSREMQLNVMPLNLRNEIISDAKTAYIKKFSNAECKQINSDYKEIINNYHNYIAAIREVLKATF